MLLQTDYENNNESHDCRCQWSPSICLVRMMDGVAILWMMKKQIRSLDNRDPGSKEVTPICLFRTSMNHRRARRSRSPGLEAPVASLASFNSASRTLGISSMWIWALRQGKPKTQQATKGDFRGSECKPKYVSEPKICPANKRTPVQWRHAVVQTWCPPKDLDVCPRIDAHNL